MDKLKQVLKYQFWILLVVALILPVVGWNMARSGMVAETEARTKKITETTGKLKTGPEDPNVDWQKGVADVNNVQKSQVRDAWLALYEHQLQFMTWPTNIPEDPTKLEPQHLQFYLKKYPLEIERVRQIVKPLDEYGENGLIDFADSLLPHPEDEWLSENRAPTAKEVEGAQEDVWLLTSLLKSIASVNSSATSQIDAPIRQVLELYLRGGSENFGAAPVAGSGMVSPGDDPAEMSAHMAAKNAGRRGGFGSAGGAGGIASVTFNPDEEMGLEVPDPEAATATGAPGAVSPGGDAEEAAMAARGFGNGPGGGVAGNSKMIRYVQDKPEWRTRGFYMELVMDHRKVPDLLVALANSDWPIRVMRVHQADVRDEELVTDDNNVAGRAAGGAAGGVGRPRAGGGGRAARMGANPDEEDQHDRGRSIGALLSGRVAAPAGIRVPGGRPGRGAPAAAASGSGALEDYMLANVAIDGVITIFKKPTEEEAPPAAGSQEVPESQTQEPATGDEPMADSAETAADTAAAPESSDATEPAAVDEAPADAAPEGASGDKPAAESTEPVENAPEEKPKSPDGGGT